MLKSNLLITFLLIIVSLYSNNINGQTKIWGVGASVGVADAEFQNGFIQDTTGHPYSPTSWTAVSIYEKAGRVTPGKAFWIRSLLGYSRDYYSNPPYGPPATPLPSPSQANGIAIFDSGYMDNDSTASVGVGSSPAGHKGELISPRIDLTGYIDSTLSIKFFSHYSSNGRNTKELSVAISTDDGATWGTPFDYRAIQADDVAGFINVPLSINSQGVTNLTQCRVKFTYDTYYFFASIDDITIQTTSNYDMAIGRSLLFKRNILDKSDIIRISGNRYYPLANVDPSDLKEWFWGAKLINFGGKTLLPQDGAKLYMTIDFKEPTTGNITPNVYRDTIDVDTLKAGNYRGTIAAKYLRDVNFIISNGAGSYKVKYWVGHNHRDGAADNDTIYHTFDITPKTSSYLSKARLRTRDNRVGYSRRFFPGYREYTHFEWGSVYYFPRGRSDSLKIDSVDFRYFIPNYNGPDSQLLAVNIHTLTDGSGAGAANGLFNADELTLVGQGFVQLSNLTTKAKRKYYIATAKNFVDPAGNPLGYLNDNGVYYISILENAASGGGASFKYSNGISFAGDRSNYSLNRFMSSADSLIINSTIVAEKQVGQSIVYYGAGYGSEYVPSIGIYLSSQTTNVSISKVALDNNNDALSVSPNPTSKTLTIELKYQSVTDVKYSFTDATGRSVMDLSDSKQITVEKRTINIEHLPAGVYFLTAKTDKETLVQKIVKE